MKARTPFSRLVTIILLSLPSVVQAERVQHAIFRSSLTEPDKSSVVLAGHCGDSACSPSCQSSDYGLQPVTCDSAVSELYSAGGGCDESACSCDSLRSAATDSWRLDAGVLFLNRSDGPNVPLVRDQNLGDVLLNAQDLDPGVQAFPYGRLIRDHGYCPGWDIGFLGNDGWGEQATAGNRVSPLFAGAGLIIGSTAPFSTFQVGTGTSLYTADINRRVPLNGCTTFLFGFRWMEVSDDLDITRTQSNVRESIFRADTNNHLYGFQLGLDSVLWTVSDRFSIAGTVRGAILANHADQSMNAPYVSNVPGFVDSLSATDDTTSFFGNVGLLSSYKLNSCLSLVGGYQLFWIEQLALAPSQLNVNDFAIPTVSGLDVTDGLFLHGAQVGLSCRF